MCCTYVLCHILATSRQHVSLCRSCVGHLLAAAEGIHSEDGELTQQLSAQRAARCMQLLQDMIKACKVTASTVCLNALIF